MTDPATSTQRTDGYAAGTNAVAATASRFVWHDLMTGDVGGALAFYTALFGWERRPWDMGPAGSYEMLYAGEEGIGGVIPLDGGGAPHWVPYLAVPDVDAACAAIERANGRTRVPPTDIPQVGRYAIAEDSTGAPFAPFRGEGTMAPPPTNAPLGTFAWNELRTGDPERAAAFYAPLTGWGVQKIDMGPLGFYWLLTSGGVPAAGMAAAPAVGLGGAHWLSYVAVASCDESAARVRPLGGKLLVPPTDIDDWGRFAIAVDPGGAAFAMLENKRPM